MLAVFRAQLKDQEKISDIQIQGEVLVLTLDFPVYAIHSNFPLKLK